GCRSRGRDRWRDGGRWWRKGGLHGGGQAPIGGAHGSQVARRGRHGLLCLGEDLRKGPRRSGGILRYLGEAGLVGSLAVRPAAVGGSGATPASREVEGPPAERAGSLRCPGVTGRRHSDKYRVLREKTPHAGRRRAAPARAVACTPRWRVGGRTTPAEDARRRFELEHVQQ